MPAAYHWEPNTQAKICGPQISIMVVGSRAITNNVAVTLT